MPAINLVGQKNGTSLQNNDGTGFLWVDALNTALGPNFVVDKGASNALVATLTSIIPGVALTSTITAGLRVLVKTKNTLQAGANTFNLNSSGTLSIKNIAGNNIKTTVASGAILDLVYDGTNWILLNSTY